MGTKAHALNGKNRKGSKLGPRLPKAPYSDEVQRVIDRLPGGSSVRFLPYVDQGQDYQPQFCHLNAKHCADKHGGERVHGWAVWQDDGFAHAEFHSVWRKPSGELVEITPPRNSQGGIMFVEDASLKIEHDPMIGADVLYAAVTSDPYPWYRVRDMRTRVANYLMFTELGSELAYRLTELGYSTLA